MRGRKAAGGLLAVLLALAGTSCTPSYVSCAHLDNGLGRTILIADCHRFSGGQCVSHGVYVRLTPRSGATRLPRLARGEWPWVVETASGRTIGCLTLRSNADVGETRTPVRSPIS